MRILALAALVGLLGLISPALAADIGTAAGVRGLCLSMWEAPVLVGRPGRNPGHVLGHRRSDIATIPSESDSSSKSHRGGWARAGRRVTFDSVD